MILCALALWQMPLTVSPLFGDHAVLQAGRPVKVFGTAHPGSVVKVTLGSGSATTVTESHGKWSVTLPPQNGTAPVELKIQSGNESLVAKDLVFGEVWLLAGQSNMEWPVERCAEFREMSREVTPGTRLFNVGKKSAEVPAAQIAGSWTVGSPGSVRPWSGIGLAMALRLRQRLNRPIGLIQATWGGTRVETWLSQRGLETVPEGSRLLKAYFESLGGFPARLAEYEERAAQWDAAHAFKDPGNSGFDSGFARADLDDHDWEDVMLPAPIEELFAKEIDGAFWFRRRFTLPLQWAGKGLRIDFGLVGNEESTYFNGLKVGAGTVKADERTYYVGPGLVRPGENVISVRVWNRSGEGGLLGPILRIGPSGGGEFVDLAGPWKCKGERVLERDPEQGDRPKRPMGPGDRNAPSSAYFGMIAPLIPVSIRGVAWYQGESNTDQPGAFGVLTKALIQDWRRRWEEPNLPFYLIQLPGYAKPAGDAWAQLREAQDAVLTLPHTGRIVTFDFGETGTIHPIKKRRVGDRLAGQILSEVYAQGPPARSPEVSLLRREGNGIRVILQSTFGGMTTADGKAPAGFEALVSGNWVAANVELFERSLRVTIPTEGRIEEVRYAWGNAPSGNLVNKIGLPLGPFRKRL